MTHVRAPLDPLPTLAENRRAFLAFVESRVGSRGDAEEILQAAFLRGVEASAQIRDEESVVAWFYRVLRNAASIIAGVAARKTAPSGGSRWSCRSLPAKLPRT